MELIKNKISIDDFKNVIIIKKLIAIYSMLNKIKFLQISILTIPRKVDTHMSHITNFIVMTKINSKYVCHYEGNSLEEAIEIYNKL